MATYGEKRLKLIAEIIKLKDQLKVAKVREWITQKESEAKSLHELHIANFVAAARLTIAKQFFPYGQMPQVDFLRIADDLTKDWIPSGDNKTAILYMPKLKKGATDQEKAMWLLQMNVQITNYVSADVRLVWNKKVVEKK